MSKDFDGGTVQSNSASRAMFELGLEAQGYLSVLARTVFPSVAKEYRDAFTKMYPYPDIPKHALFLGQVMVQNMVVHQHRDAGDGKMCSIFHVSDVKGGHLYLPQLLALHR